jgi:uncharacterized phage protein (TIGR01671 family)
MKMKDRFKFRAWNKLEKTMFHNLTVGNGHIIHCDVNKNILNDKLTTAFNPEFLEIMQCTGFKDNKGNLVYEGDIIKSYNDEICVIKYDDVEGGLFIYSEDNDHPMCNLNFKFTVIGNIYENPELLEV